MDVLKFSTGVAGGAIPLLFALLLWRWVHARRAIGSKNALFAMLAGGGLAALDIYLEGLFLGVTGLSPDAARVGASSAMLTTFLFIAPLEQGSKVLAVWPLYRLRVLDGSLLGMLYAVCAGAGFGAVATFHHVVWAPAIEGEVVLRALLGAPAHLFFAGVWGFALGTRRAGRRHQWFSVAFFAAMLLHGLYAHIVFGRGPALLVAVVPLVLGMLVVTWVALRDAGVIQSSHHSLLGSFEPPSIETVQRALARKNRPLMPHWIVLSALVTIGVMMTLLALAVYFGNRIGIDFAVTNEGDWRSVGPLTLLGVALLASFPLAGYLVARATAATSVLEPALGAGLAMGALVGLFSAAAPVAVVFVLAAAPVAFGLACGGAWFGLAR